MIEYRITSELSFCALCNHYHYRIKEIKAASKLETLNIEDGIPEREAKRNARTITEEKEFTLRNKRDK
jgi:hypothetical protein